MPRPLTVPPARETEVLDLTVGSQQFRVVHDLGAPGAVPFVLMNGIGARLELLQPFVDQLSLERPVIRFDVPGVGGSPLPKRLYRLRGLSHQVAEIVRQLGYSQADVLGISWGGGLAQQFAHSERKMCRKLVLVATATGSLMIPAHPRVLSKMITHRRYTDPEYMISIAKEIYGGTMRTDPGEALAALRLQSEHHNLGYFGQLAAGMGWTSIPFLPASSSRPLVLSGDDDPLIPVCNGRIIAKLVPNSELIVYTGGHLAMVTEAADIAPRIEEFLDRP